MCISTRFICTEFLTVSETYDWLLVNRPTEVCRQVVGNEVRTIGSGSFARSQVRFECLPGEISHSDFPQIPNDKRKKQLNFFLQVFQLRLRVFI